VISLEAAAWSSANALRSLLQREFLIAMLLRLRLLCVCYSICKASTHCVLSMLAIQSWVGIMLIKQPFYIGGIDNLETCKGSAFGAAGAFLFTFLLSIGYLIQSGRPGQGVRRERVIFDDYDDRFPMTSQQSEREAGTFT
jgi:hypothetical protein